MPPTDAVYGCVDVSVADLHGMPVPRATVELAAEEDGPTATTDDDGHARLVRVEPGWHVVCARRPGGERGVGDLLRVAAGQVVQSSVTLEPRCALRVRVIDDDGTPCAGIDVTAMQSGSPLRIREQTAADGRCRLDELRAGPWWVCAERAGADATSATVHVPMADELLLIARTPALAVGRVTDHGTGLPVAGARVGVSRSRDVEAWDAVLSDADGRFTVALSPECDIAGGFVVASAPGYVPASAVYAKAALRPISGGAHRTDVRLRPTGIVEVSVVSDDGPVAERHVRLEDVPEWGEGRRTDARGRITFASAPPGAHAVVDADGLYDLEPARVVVPSVGRADVVLHATPRAVASVAGVVVAADGTPLPGAQVMAWGLTPPVVTDTVGAFALRIPGRVGTRTLRLTVTAAGRPRETHDVALAENGVTTVHVVLDRLAEFRGRLVAETGVPIQGATLRCAGAPDGVRCTSTVAEDGTFRVTAPQRDPDADVCSFEVLGGGIASQPFEFRTPVGGAHDLGDVVVVSCEPVVAHVVDESGSPVVGATVCGDGLYARTDDAGAFTHLPSGGTAPVRISAVGYVTRSTELTSVAGELVLRRRQDLAGRLLFADGSPAAGAVVRVCRDESTFAPTAAVTDPSGRFVVRDVRAHGLVAVAWEPGGGNDSPQPTPGLVRDVVLTGAELAFRAERGRRVEGVVEDSSGAGVPCASVTMGADGPPSADPRTTTTDCDGRFVIEGLPESEDAFVSVSCDLGELELRGVRTSLGVPLTLRFGRLVTTGGSLRLPAGYAIDGETIRASPCEPFPAGPTPGDVIFAVRADGSFEFDGVAGVTYFLEFEHTRRFLESLAPDARAPAGRRDILVQAQLGLSIRGVVKDGSGAGVSGVTLATEYSDRAVRATTTAEDGAFDLTGLFRDERPCELFLTRAAADGAPAMDLRIDGLARGTSDVRLIADPATRLSFRIRSPRNFGVDVRVRGPVATAYRHVSRERDTVELAWLTPGAEYAIDFPAGGGKWTVLGTVRAGTFGAVFDAP